MPYFSVIQSSPALAPFVRHYTVLRVNNAAYDVQRVIPVGCMELMIYQKGTVVHTATSNNVPHAFIGGNTSSFIDLKPQPGEVYYISILFRPHGVAAFFDIPANKFYNNLVPVNDLEDAGWQELCSRIADTGSVRGSIALIESFLLKRLSSNKMFYYDRITEAIQTIDRDCNTVVPALAQQLCLSEKQFKRVFNAYVGCNPKEYMRIIRFNRALALLKASGSPDFSRIAHECGYSDQSHFIREFKSFSGYTPNRILAPATGFHYSSID